VCIVRQLNILHVTAHTKILMPLLFLTESVWLFLLSDIIFLYLSWFINKVVMLVVKQNLLCDHTLLTLKLDIIFCFICCRG